MKTERKWIVLFITWKWNEFPIYIATNKLYKIFVSEELSIKWPNWIICFEDFENEKHWIIFKAFDATI